MWGAAMVAALLVATPTFVTRGDVTPEAELRREAEAAWKALEARYVAEAGGAPAKAPGVLDERLRVALRHELAHQLLWWACPQSSEDRLFHEAFAVAVSGELAAWGEGPYQSLSRAASE